MPEAVPEGADELNEEGKQAQGTQPSDAQQDGGGRVSEEEALRVGGVKSSLDGPAPGPAPILEADVPFDPTTPPPQKVAFPAAPVGEDGPDALDAEATGAVETVGRRWWNRRAVVISGVGVLVVAGVVGSAFGWHATGTEEYPPLVAAWILLTPLAVAAATFAVRRGPAGHRRLRRATGAAVAFLFVGGLAITTERVDPCDLRGPGVVLVGCNLTGRDLRGDNLANSDLRGANLSKAKLGGAILTRAKLTEARLTRADLGKAILAEANLEGAFLDGANLAGATLDHAVLTGARLAGADLSDASLARTRLGGASLDGARLVGSSLQETDLSRANLAGTDLSQARGSRMKLAAAILTGATLDGARLGDADFGAANLTGASLAGTDLSGLRAVGADFSHAVLQGTELRKATLDRATFAGARLENANLQEASLKDTIMTGVTMSNVSLDSAQLGGVVNLDDATLAAALRVEPAKVSRTLSLRSVQFEPPGRILADVGLACVGTAAVGTRAFTDSPEFHPNLVLNGAGKASDIGPLRQLRAFARDQKWAPAGLRYAELVTCVDDEDSRQVQDCGPYRNRDTGDARNVVRVQLSRQIRVVSVATGQTVTERRFLGETPRACQSTESSPGTGPITIRGTAPSADEMQAWLTDLVKA